MANARFIILWETPSDPEEFDRHYREVHIPLARSLPGLRRYSLGRDAVTVGGGDPCHLVAELEWDSMEDLQAAFASPEGQAAGADVAVLQKLAAVRSMIYTLDGAL